MTFDIEAYRAIVRLTVTHEDLPSDKDSDLAAQGWPAVLSNLKSLLETGSALPETPWEMPARAATARLDQLFAPARHDREERGHVACMQTFLPYPSFAASAAALDECRLGKQRIEALQVLRALTWAGYGWQHHPAVTMWRGHEEALAAYGLAMAREWTARGHPDTCAASIQADFTTAGFPGAPRPQDQLLDSDLLPWWLGDEAVHASHRAALVRRTPEHYGPLFPDADPDQPYVWPPPPDVPA